MSSIGLYDLDFWHYQKKAPNLELMKVFNYHYQNNDMVKLLRPQDNFGRFNKIIFFKDRIETRIPEELIVYGEGKEIYGYGFYKSFYPLEEKYQSYKPNYLCYEPFNEKFSKNLYKIFLKSSYVRYENMDMTDYSRDKKILTIADHNFVDMPDATYFLNTYMVDKFNCKNPIIFNDEETYWKFYDYLPLSIRQYRINFRFSEEVLKRYTPRIQLDYAVKYDKETDDDVVARAAATALYLKSKKIIPYLNGAKNSDLINKIKTWSLDKDFSSSFYQYYQNDKELLKIIDNSVAKIKIILKMTPEKLKSSNIDLSYFL